MIPPCLARLACLPRKKRHACGYIARSGGRGVYDCGWHNKRGTPVGQRLVILVRHVLAVAEFVQSDGFIDASVLEWFDPAVTPERVREACKMQLVCARHDPRACKRRFETRVVDGRLQVWVYQGHTNSAPSPMRPWDGVACWHGTTLAAWASIAKEGLRPMSRRYVHASLTPGSILGNRVDSEVYVLIKADGARTRSGCEFLITPNDVVQCPAAIPPSHLVPVTRWLVRALRRRLSAAAARRTRRL